MTLIMDRPTVAFATLYEQFYGAVHAYAARRVGDDGADEIAAETFLIAWRRWKVVPEEPLPWLYGAARNVVLRHHEAARRQSLARQAAERERPPAPVHADTTGGPPGAQRVPAPPGAGLIRKAPAPSQSALSRKHGVALAMLALEGRRTGRRESRPTGASHNTLRETSKREAPGIDRRAAASAANLAAGEAFRVPDVVAGRCFRIS